MSAESDNAGQLLGGDDPPPVRVLRPEGRSDFLLTADHAGRAIPRRLGTLGLADSELMRHIAWDIGIAGVTERLAEALDAAAILQNYSRLVIDCNRQPGLDSSIPTGSVLSAIRSDEDLTPATFRARMQAMSCTKKQRVQGLITRRRSA